MNTLKRILITVLVAILGALIGLAVGVFLTSCPFGWNSAPVVTIMRILYVVAFCGGVYLAATKEGKTSTFFQFLGFGMILGGLYGMLSPLVNFPW